MAQEEGFPRCLRQRSKGSSLRSSPLGRPLAPERDPRGGARVRECPLDTHVVRIPCTFPGHEKSPIAGAHTYQWRRRRDSRVAFGNAQRVRRFAPHPLAGHWRQSETLAGALGSVSVHWTLTWFESPAPSPDMKRAPSLGLILTNGGGGGIRTLVPREGVNGFRDRRIQPLCHPSVRVTRRPDEDAAGSSGGESGI